MSNQTTVRTFHAREEDVDKKWYVVDAEGMVLGRLAANVAHILRGKHKPIFSPHVDTGDFVIVINAGKVRVTGKRFEQKSYFHYTGYPGGGYPVSEPATLSIWHRHSRHPPAGQPVCHPLTPGIRRSDTQPA